MNNNFVESDCGNPPFEDCKQSKIEKEKSTIFLYFRLHNAEYVLTSKMTAPRATHLTMFQFSFKNLYIIEKSPVLSAGMS